jgi:hypothetical protein
MKIFIGIFVLYLASLPAASQAKMSCTDENLPKNLPNYEDLRACAIPQSERGDHTERVIQIGSLHPRILDLHEFMLLSHPRIVDLEKFRPKYSAKAVNSVLFELLMDGQLNQEGLQKKLRRMQFNADSELVAVLEKWVKILSVQNFIKNELGPAFDYLEDYKNFLQYTQLTNNKRQIGGYYWWKAMEKIELLISYSSAQSYCVFDISDCKYSDQSSLVNFTPSELDFPPYSGYPTLVYDSFSTTHKGYTSKGYTSEVAPEMSSIMSKYYNTWDQRVSIMNAIIDKWPRSYRYAKEESCVDQVKLKFIDLWDSKFADPWYNGGFLEILVYKPPYYYQVKELNHWVVGTYKIIAHLEQALLDFNDIFSHLDVIEKDQQGFLSSWRILSQDIVNTPNSPGDLISYLEAINLTLPPSSIYAKNAILDILRSTEKIRYLYADNFLSVIDEEGIQEFFRKLKKPNESDYEWEIRENRYHFRILTEQLRFDEARIKKQKQKLLDSEYFHNVINQVVNLELDKLQYYKSLQHAISQCPDS